MNSDINCPEEPWQISLVGSKEKLNALFYIEKFSDLIITFPRKAIKYKAHKIIMAASSSIFEGMLYGPMAITGSVLELPDDNPEVFRIVLGSCYEVDIEPSDIDMALEVYLLADKYFMEYLRKDCTQKICKLLDSENANRILEFATYFNFESLKAFCFQALVVKYKIDVIDSSKVLLEVYMLADKYFMEHLRKECAQQIGKLLDSENVNKILEFVTRFNFESLKAVCFQALEVKFKIDVIDSSKMLLVLQSNWLQELQESDIKISRLVFQDSWRYPDEMLSDNIVLKILLGNFCCYKGLRKFSGCVSAKVIKNICWKYLTNLELCISLTNYQQCEEVISLLCNKDEFTIDPKFYSLSIHVQCSRIPANSFMHLPKLDYLLISEVDDHGIHWVASCVGCSLKQQKRGIDSISYVFPKSKLTFKGLKKLLTLLPCFYIYSTVFQICSSEIPSSKKYELAKWIKSNLPHRVCNIEIILFDRNEEINGW